jgi:Ca-activated chloride channel homolog
VFDFAWPWAGLVLVLPLLVRWFWPRLVNPGEELLEGRQTTLLHPRVARLQHAYQGRRPRSPIAGKLHGLLLALFWIALTLALMQPRWLEPHTEVRTEGYDLMLAVDTSRSMTALDFSHDNRPISRMAVVKGVMDRFIENRKGDRVGLVIFGNQAFVQSPLTFDLDAVRRILADIAPGMAGDATAMGDAVALSVKKLRERPPGSRVLLLVTDGESTAGLIPPLQAAALASREGVRIYAIGVGSNQAEVLIQGTDGQYRNESDIGLDEDTLKRIARATGGEYYRATDTHALEAIYQKIDTLEKTEAETRTTLIPHPLFRWPLGAALLFLFLLGLFPEGRMRVPGGHRHA